MKILISVVIFIVLFLFMARAEITFNPFSVKLNSLLFAIGAWLIILGIAFIQIEEYRDGHLKGYKKGCEEMSEAASELIKEYKSND